MAHAPRHSGGFSRGQSVIGGGSSSTPSTPAQNTGPFGAFFGAGASSDPIPGATTQPASGNQFAQYQQAADTMQQAGIGSLSGATTDTTQGQAAAAIQNAFQQSQGTDTSGSGTDTTGTGQGTDTTGTETESPLDKFNNFMAFGKPIKDLKDNDLKLILEQVKLYQDGMPNYFQGIPGGFNFVKGMFNSMGQGLKRSGEFGGIKGSPTLEGLEDFIRTMDEDSNMLDAFKKADPAAYLDTFGLPATDAGLDFFANLSLDDDTVDKLTQQKIIEARERLNDKTKLRRQEKYPEGIQGVGAGIPSIATALTPFTDVNNNGILDTLEVAQATTTPVTATIPVTGVPSLTPTTIDYASMGPQYGGYVNQGISDPRFASYFQNLNLFPRRS